MLISLIRVNCSNQTADERLRKAKEKTETPNILFMMADDHHFINEKQELVLMSLKINWEQLESELSVY